MNTQTIDEQMPSGEFVSINNERYYAIKDVDQMETFFISLISNSDHWMFIGSNGALTAGRVSPDTALFPYDCVDKIYDNVASTGSKTIIRVHTKDGIRTWEPFNFEQTSLYKVRRNLYKNTPGNKLIFEEINKDLGLRFKYTWQTSDTFGFVRTAEVINISEQEISLEWVDGLQNILPAGTPKFTQTISSNLVDAYKYNELDENDGLALYTLYSAITDRAEPSESLRASTVYSLGLDSPTTLLSNKQLKAFKNGLPVSTEADTRGIRGAYFVSSKSTLAASGSQSWHIVANVEQDQGQISKLKQKLSNKNTLGKELEASILEGDKELAKIMASADGFQLVNEEVVGVHHYANTLFNVLRGGIFSDQYTISKSDLLSNIKHFNRQVYAQHKDALQQLPSSVALAQLQAVLKDINEPQLTRLCNEYLPIYFGRRHGDPSRPWNQFVIKLKDEQQQALLTYQGNWRDIFQNWESLSYSYPEYVEGIIAKFVNASTMDGYNPYRITKEGIDWEVEEPDDPWSYIGYWGDHQIIYLLKLLEMSKDFHPETLAQLLQSKIYSYANVPYKIKTFEDIVLDAKNTVEYDEELAAKIEAQCETLGADGKLVLDTQGQVYQVNLLEKLMVPLLSKLGNLVIDGGIWLNTQRPEWNDANNALVGQGVSVVTLNYLRRYVVFLQDLIKALDEQSEMSVEVATWLTRTSEALDNIVPQLKGKILTAQARYEAVCALGKVASEFRTSVYQQQGFTGTQTVSIASVQHLLSQALVAIEHTISTNKREDGMYHAYNLLDLSKQQANLSYLSPMLEGQVAALSSGALSTSQCIEMVDSLFASDVYRADQKTFMLYPDKVQTPFMQKNNVDKGAAKSISSLQAMLSDAQTLLISEDADSNIRFNADIKNKGDVSTRIAALSEHYPSLAEDAEAIFELYENTFNHLAFTGRSGGMFGFEGLGSIYWHMVSKLLLALGENAQRSANTGESTEELHALCEHYYRVREGIGFNKTPQEYGAFPADPYSHTPKHAGAQQPGMTGQVKEELISRFIELGIQVNDGAVTIKPFLLREQEFLTQAVDFSYLDTNKAWQNIAVAKGELAFTWCQVPFVYRLCASGKSQIQVDFEDGTTERFDTLNLASNLAQHIFERTGKIKQVTVDIEKTSLFGA